MQISALWRRSLSTSIVGGCLLGLLGAILVEVSDIAFGSNFHALVPGSVYRCAQPTTDDLERAVRNYGIRTVVNLRGNCEEHAWFLEESQATHRLGLAQEDLCFSTYRLPAVNEVRQLMEVFDRSEPPLLIHCRRGADRTGLASAIYLLTQCEVSVAEARRQLHWRYGHLALGRTRYLAEFFNLYTGWLHVRGLEHSQTAFRQWVTAGYCAGGCKAELTPLDFPTTVPCGQPRALRVRARNMGVKPWQLKPEKNAGIHLGYSIIDDQDQPVALDRSGLFDATVQPGESIVLTLVLPAQYVPGRCTLWIDMVDEQQCWFYQTGSEPLEWDLEVR